MGGLVASLGMYDHPRQRAANDAIWSHLSRSLRRAGIDAPDHLDRSRMVEDIWRDPSLLLAQACGYPLVSQADLAVRVIAIPEYDVPECAPGQHVSHIVVRADDARNDPAAYRGHRAAVNSSASNTGYNLFRHFIAPHARSGEFFSDVIVTGAHRASVRAVADGKADMAAIDAVSFAALARFEADLAARVRIIATTAPSPTLPFVTARSTDGATVRALRAALTETMADAELTDARAALFLTGVRATGDHRLAEVSRLDRAARDAGYPMLMKAVPLPAA
jgi:ABC-type phosphate/phosphonate transport system substrate-binding protein